MKTKEKIKWATIFHETYERLAPSFGYETRENTKEFDPKSKNGKLMLEVCSIVLSLQKQEIVEEIEKIIRKRLGMDCGYIGCSEAWDWDLDNLPNFEDFIDQLKQTLTK